MRRNYRRQKDYARLIQMRDGSIAFESSYDPDLVQALKSQIPWQERRWMPDEKQWRVDPKHAQTLKDIARNYLGVTCDIQGNIFNQTPQVEIKMLKLEYLGTAKDRGGDEPTAFGWVDDNWNAVFPLSVLKTWFNIAVHDNVTAVTLYGVLGIKSDIPGTEIKTAYRRAAKQWHPDVNKEPDATKQFKRIQNAYDILSNPMSRRKYDAGRAFEKTLGRGKMPSGAIADIVFKSATWWYPPLRCGWITAQGVATLGRFNIEKIITWQDITSGNKTMVSTWPSGAEHFDVKWV